MFRRILVIAGVVVILAAVPAVAAASVPVMGSSTSNTQIRTPCADGPMMPGPCESGGQSSDGIPEFGSFHDAQSYKNENWGTVPGASWLSNEQGGLNPRWTEYRTSFSKLSGDHEYVVKFLVDNAVVRMTVNDKAFGCTLAVPCAGFWQSSPLEQAIPADSLNATGNELRLVVRNDVADQYGNSDTGGLAFSVVAAERGSAGPATTTPSAGGSDTVTQGVTAGGRTASFANLTMNSVAYSHSSQNNTGSLTLTADDSTGSGSGWNVTVLASAFAYSGSATDATAIPAANFSLSSAAAPVATAGQAVDATNGPKVPDASPVGTLDSARKFVQANPSYGLGTYTQALGVALTVPAQSRAGTYTGTLTTTIAAAP